MVRINNTTVPANARGAYDPAADVEINTGDLVTFHIETNKVQAGAWITVTMSTETNGQKTERVQLQAGSTTAQVNMVVPHGYSRYFVQADW